MINIIKSEFNRRIIQEGLSRIERCLTELTEEQVWHKQNSNTNSMGNIILHLCGNVNQYINSGIGNFRDERNRPLEFLLSSRIGKDALIEKITAVVTNAQSIVDDLQAQSLTENRTVQGFDETVLSIIIHVIEHFSYHVGQITFYTKYIKNIDTGYYSGLDLDVTS